MHVACMHAHTRPRLEQELSVYWLYRFQLAPPSIAKEVAVFLMILHNVQAWVLWMTAFGFM